MTIDTKQDAENAGWQFFGYENTHYRQIEGDHYVKVNGEVWARKRVGENVIEKSSDTIARLLVDIADWEAHPARAAA